MSDWLRDFDRLSFWLGFLAASLFWFLVSRALPWFERLRATRHEQSLEQRQERRLNDEIRLANDMLRHAQHLHLGAPLFSLDEVLVPPRLLAPPVPPEAYEPPPSSDITDWVIPNMPDWPDMAAYYGAPWLTPAEALHGGANIAIIGQPGSGKTVALAHLAGEVIRWESATGAAADLSAVLVHIGDVLGAPGDDPVEKLLAAVSPYVTSIPGKRLPAFLRGLLAGDRLLLLLDGLDELAPEQLETALDWLESLLQAHPGLRSAVTAHANLLGRLPALGFQPLALAPWNLGQRAMLISRWSDLWNRHITAEAKSRSPTADPLLVIGWMLNNTANLNPLELTLKVWAALAGDSLGQGSIAAVEAYLRRIMAGQPEKNRSGFEQLAAQVVLTGQSLMDRGMVERWLGGTEIAGDVPIPAEPAGDEPPDGLSDGAQKMEKVRARGALPDLLDSGLLIARGADRFSILNPALTGYLAAQYLATQKSAAARAITGLAEGPDWSGQAAALSCLAVLDPQGAWIGHFLREDEADPLSTIPLRAGRWLRTAPEGMAWISPLMRLLAGLVQRDDAPLAVKLRALTALVLSGSPGVPTLLRQLSTAQAPSQRRLAALGLGMVREPKATPDLIRMANERIPEIYHAAVLALVACGEKSGLEAVANLLVAGDESQSRAAAEALANHPEEGFPTLEEASRLEDPGVRRAAVFGLGRTRQSWAIDILERLRSEDTQWTVQDAAGQVLNGIQGENPRLPRPLPALPQLPWLIAFAAERGMGISPGKPAVDMLLRALKEGDRDQIQAAIYYLEQRGDEAGVLPLYQIFFSQRNELREQAYSALRSLQAAGAPLPAPSQFGLH